MADNVLYFTAGDTLPAISGTLVDANGNPVDITDWTIKMKIAYDIPIEIEGELGGTPVNGEFSISAFDSSTFVEGTWFAEIEFTTDDDGVQTGNVTAAKERFKIHVYPKIVVPEAEPEPVP